MLAAIQADATFFDQMVNLIPSKFYFESELPLPSKYQNKTTTDLNAIKHARKVAREAKFDPSASQATVDLIPKFDTIPSKDAYETTPIELKEKLISRIQQLEEARNSHVKNPKKRSPDHLTEARKKSKSQKEETRHKKPVPPPKPASPAPRTSIPESLQFSKFGNAVKSKRLDPKAALQKIDLQKKDLDLMAKADAKKVGEINEQNSWKKVISMAKGEKQFDDEKLLKKTLKNREREKTKSSKVWKERLESVDTAINAKQTKRTENLQKRITDKKNKKKRK